MPPGDGSENDTEGCASARVGERAYRLMESGYHCSEAVLLAVGEYLVGEVPAPALRAANGFRGGVGSSRQELCGALSGGVMALGLAYGRESATEDDEYCAELVRRWRDAFLARFLHTRCEPIYALMRQPDAPGNCCGVAREAARSLVRLLEDERLRGRP